MAESDLSGPLTIGGGGVGVGGTGVVNSDVVGNVTGNVTGSVKGAVQVLTGAGAIDTTSAYTSLVTTGANTVTLAVPTNPGLVKVVSCDTHGGNGTLAMTNIVNLIPSSSASASITFTGTSQEVVLVAGNVSGKWYLTNNGGTTLA
jgi:hypothetical protein